MSWEGDPERGCGLMVALLVGLALWVAIVLLVGLAVGWWKP